MTYLMIYIALISLATFMMFGIDKYKAKRGLWRLSENQLLILVSLGGGLGALAGMEIFRHKTVKTGFLWKFRGILFLWIAVVGYVVVIQ